MNKKYAEVIREEIEGAKAKEAELRQELISQVLKRIFDTAVERIRGGIFTDEGYSYSFQMEISISEVIDQLSKETPTIRWDGMVDEIMEAIVENGFEIDGYDTVSIKLR